MPFFNPLIIAPWTVLMNQLLNNMNATSDHVFIQSMHHSTLDYSDESAVNEGHRSGVSIASVTTTSTVDPVLSL